MEPNTIFTAFSGLSKARGKLGHDEYWSTGRMGRNCIYSVAPMKTIALEGSCMQYLGTVDRRVIDQNKKARDTVFSLINT